MAGSATVATAFGMARYGYGLLLPDIQDDLALGATALGAIGTLAYVAYVLATVVVTRCVARAGERATVVAGGLFAVAGTIVVALAERPALLGAGRTFVLTALLEAAAIATVGVAADSLLAVLVAGAAFGAAYNTIVTVTVLWGTRVYADSPSTGIATAAGANAVGLLCGPLAGGIVADAIGLTATLLAGATVVLAAALFAPRGDVVQNETT